MRHGTRQLLRLPLVASPLLTPQAKLMCTQVSVNFNWDALKPMVQTALKRLADPGPAAVAGEAAERHKRLASERATKLVGGAAQGAAAAASGVAGAQPAAGAGGGAAKAAEGPAAGVKPTKADAKLQQGGSAASRKEGKDAHNRALSNSPPVATGAVTATATSAAGTQQQQAWQQPQQQAAKAAKTQQPAAVDAAAGEALLAAPGRSAADGTPLSEYKCAFDNGKPENRLCVFTNLLVHGGKVYFVAGEGGRISACLLPAPDAPMTGTPA